MSISKATKATADEAKTTLRIERLEQFVGKSYIIISPAIGSSRTFCQCCKIPARYHFVVDVPLLCMDLLHSDPHSAEI